MGTWGNSITQDDVVLDVTGIFEHYLKYTRDISETTKLCLRDFAETLEDEDEGSLVWIAIAKSQWEYGKVDDEIINRICTELEQENGFDRWKEVSEEVYFERKREISNFIERISQPNLKLKKIPKLVLRKPSYKDGDCLSLQITETEFGAAIVTKTDESDPEYGKNLVVVLDYLSTEVPTIEVFNNAPFLHLKYANSESSPLCSWCNSVGYRNFKKRINIIGNTDVSAHQQVDCAYYSGWDYLFGRILRIKGNKQ